MDESHLTEAEKKRGWVAYCCPAHGFLVAGPATFTVICGVYKCRKLAEGWRGAHKVKTGRMVKRKTWTGR